MISTKPNLRHPRCLRGFGEPGSSDLPPIIHVKIEDLYLAVNRGQIRNGEKALLESQPGCQVLAKFNGFVDLPNRFGAAWRPIGEGECAHAEALIEHLGVRRDRALTTAPHSRKESPLRRDALLCIE